MSNRSIRRAIEHKARKLEHKQLQMAAAAGDTNSNLITPFIPEAAAENADISQEASSAHVKSRLAQFGQRPSYETTQNQINANRANAQKSSGPVSLAGKAVSSRNALKHGLTGSTILLDSDDADEYQNRLDYYTDLYQPATFEERRLVQAVNDATWRLDRITNLESTVYAKGRIELENSFEEIPQAQRKNFIQLEISQRYAKDLRNLHLQESRIQRQRAKDLAALKELQAERREAESEAKAAAEDAAKSTSDKPKPQLDGFVFSIPETPAIASEFVAGTTSEPTREAA